MPVPLKAGEHEAVADLGGSILTGIDGNPLAVLARQLKIPLHEIEQTQVDATPDNVRLMYAKRLYSQGASSIISFTVVM